MEAMPVWSTRPTGAQKRAQKRVKRVTSAAVAAIPPEQMQHALFPGIHKYMREHGVDCTYESLIGVFPLLKDLEDAHSQYGSSR